MSARAEPQHGLVLADGRVQCALCWVIVERQKYRVLSVGTALKLQLCQRCVDSVLRDLDQRMRAAV